MAACIAAVLWLVGDGMDDEGARVGVAVDICMLFTNGCCWFDCTVTIVGIVNLPSFNNC